MSNPCRHLITLNRRVNFLDGREHKNTFDLAELSALRWALNHCRQIVAREEAVLREQKAALIMTINGD